MSKHSRIEPGSLTDHLYTHRSLKELEQLLADGFFEMFKRQWALSDEQCQQQIELAMHYIRRD